MHSMWVLLELFVPHTTMQWITWESFHSSHRGSLSPLVQGQQRNRMKISSLFDPLCFNVSFSFFVSLNYRSENLFERYSRSTLTKASHQTGKGSSKELQGFKSARRKWEAPCLNLSLSVSSVSSLSLPEANATTPPDPSGVEAGKSLECVVKDEDLYSQYFTFWLSKTNLSKWMKVLGQRAKAGQQAVGLESHLDDISISNVPHVQDWVCASVWLQPGLPYMVRTMSARTWKCACRIH